MAAKSSKPKTEEPKAPAPPVDLAQLDERQLLTMRARLMEAVARIDTELAKRPTREHAHDQDDEPCEKPCPGCASAEEVQAIADDVKRKGSALMRCKQCGKMGPDADACPMDGSALHSWEFAPPATMTT